ncbi:MAG: hypothetical protein FWD42_05250, partial [Solirubrobacterales bacterium]|nr:hypothetical protein [Solirubrobacterales bacterium]
MRPAARLCGALALAALIALRLGSGQAGPHSAFAHSLGARAAAASAAQLAGSPPTAADRYEPVLGLPATGLVVLGAAPGGQPGETWAYGELGDVPTLVGGVPYADQTVLLRYTDAAGWEVVPLPSGQNGGPLIKPNNYLPSVLGPLGGRVTADGGVALLTDAGAVIREPDGHMRLAPPPPSELLAAGESLPPERAPNGATTPFAATEENSQAGGGTPVTGMLIAPYDDGAPPPAAPAEGSSPPAVSSTAPGATAPGQLQPGVLHYDGSQWTREPLEGPSTGEPRFTPEALACGATAGGSGAGAGAGAAQSCWLLAAYTGEGTSVAPDRLALFRRVRSPRAPGFAWRQEEPAAGGLLAQGTPLAPGAPMLTVSAQGVWVDFHARLGAASTQTSVTELVLPAPETSGGGSATASLQASAAGTWCYPTSTEAGCTHTLGARFPATYQSFAWPGASAAESGTRIITPMLTGAMLELSPATGGEFAYTPGTGAEPSPASGSAFGAPQSGWIGQGSPEGGQDSEGNAQLVRAGESAQGDRLQEEPVPFGRPLLAVAQAPGTAPGDPNAEAIAVGVGGEIGRYIPNEGWRAESLYGASGEQATLRGVAWPERGRAYAVGDNGTMWLWRADTGLWEPDPATPYNFIGNLSAVAFSPADPNRGYAVGKQGVLLRYGKTWTQEALPEGLQDVNFTSVAFAGGEALASYRALVKDGSGEVESGGLAVEDGTGWHVDPAASALLATLPYPGDDVLSKVAGLPDGGAAAAGPGLVIERDSAAGPWRFSAAPLPEAQNIAALGAYRDAAGAVRALVSIDLDGAHNPAQVGTNETAYFEDALPLAAPGRPPPHAGADPIPSSGYLLQETASGWRDMEHMALGMPAQGSREPHDLPIRPDPVLALLVDPTGQSGLAVGGQTDNTRLSPTPHDPFQTAAAMRFGTEAPAVGGDAPATIQTNPSVATFAVGGGAACGYLCADAANEGLGPDVLLTHALQSARQISAGSPGGLRGFLYTGERLSAESSSLSADDFDRELARYAQLLGAAAPLPVHVAAAPSDVAPGRGLEPFINALHGYGPEGTGAYYSFLSEGAQGTVMVIVLDYSSGALGPEQRVWLESRLSEAKTQLQVPAIVMGNAALDFALPDRNSEGPLPVEASDAGTVSAILVQGGASAYIFDYPGVNIQTEVRYGSARIPAFGSGALGYSAPPSSPVADSLVSSGFMLVEVNAAARNPASDVAPVSARLEPNIGQLALDATDGVLLRRSHVALFEALARLPASGRAANGAGGRPLRGPRPYEAIPFNCEGSNCPYAVASDYTFTSSKPDIAGFVAREAASGNPRQVELGANRLPIADEPRDAGGELLPGGRFQANRQGEPINEHGQPVPREQSGLLCAYNEGTTVISITAGGLTYSEPIRVQGGSVEYPCGTVPLRNPPPRGLSTELGLPLSFGPEPTEPSPSAPVTHLSLPPPAPVVHHVVNRPNITPPPEIKPP